MNPQQPTEQQPEQASPLPQASEPQTPPMTAEPTDQPQQQDNNSVDQQQYSDHEESIAWEASESIHHEKDITWFIGIIAAGVLLSIVSILLLRSITFTILIVVMVVALIVLARRPPRVLHYELHETGVRIDEKPYSFREFKSFGVVHDGPFYYVSLIPAKRFMPAIDIYFPEEFGEEIVDIIGSQIPLQTITPDWLDKITKHLRF